MTPNIDPASGVAYGYVAANDLESELVDALLYGGAGVSEYVDHGYQEARKQAEAEARAEWENNCETLDIARQEDGLEPAVHDDFEFDEDTFNDRYQDDEMIVSGIKNGVHYRSSWLGGALNFWIFKSDLVTTSAGRASPCVPNAGILHHPASRDGDVIAYDVPPDWWHTANTWEWEA